LSDHPTAPDRGIYGEFDRESPAEGETQNFTEEAELDLYASEIHHIIGEDMEHVLEIQKQPNTMNQYMDE
jgi:hypothetical protein